MLTYYAATALLLIPLGLLVLAVAKDTEKLEQERLHASIWYNVVQRTHAAIVVVDATTTKIVGWNRGAEDLFGWSEDQILGNSMSLFLPGDYLAIHHQRLHDEAVRAKLNETSVMVDCWVKVNDPEDPLRFVRVHIRGLGGDGPCRYLLTFEPQRSVQQIDKVIRRPRPDDTLLQQPEPQPLASYINLLRDK